MAFTTLSFIFVFLPIAVLLYFLVPAKYSKTKDWILIFLSLVFYGWGDAKAVPVLLASLLFNYFTGIEIAYFENQGNSKMKKIMLMECIGVNALILGIFKYTTLAMPVGISFYTFSALSYVADIYMDKVEEKPSFRESALYMVFFPKLVSGPIVKFRDFKRDENRAFDKNRLFQGSALFVTGMFKKVLIADQLGAVFNQVQAMDNMSFATAWLGMIFYSFQLYFDFSGYSDMAIGIGKIFGFEIDKNFDHPYISKNISEFWRRWHITLGGWFKEYVYIPLGGNRCSKEINIRNLFVVWLLTGIWHGSSLNFVIWGLYHGAFVILEKHVIKDRFDKVPSVIRILICDFIVFVGWIFFFSPDLGSAIRWIGNLFGIGASGSLKTSFYLLYSNLVILIIAVLASGEVLQRVSKVLFDRKDKKHFYFGVAVYVILIIFAISKMVASTYSSFLYFKF